MKDICTITKSCYRDFAEQIAQKLEQRSYVTGVFYSNAPHGQHRLEVSIIAYRNAESGEIHFTTGDMEGNALIALCNADGDILWSWHIWFTDDPRGQEYYNNAGTMMDRNLGATSATPGDVGALGLLYQWGRKDPFLGSSSIHYESETRY